MIAAKTCSWIRRALIYTGWQVIIVRAKFRIVTKDRGKDQALYKCTYCSSEALNRDQFYISWTSIPHNHDLKTFCLVTIIPELSFSGSTSFPPPVSSSRRPSGHARRCVSSSSQPRGASSPPVPSFSSPPRPSCAAGVPSTSSVGPGETWATGRDVFNLATYIHTYIHTYMHLV